jgi:hypothetical protein
MKNELTILCPSKPMTSMKLSSHPVLKSFNPGSATILAVSFGSISLLLEVDDMSIYQLQMYTTRTRSKITL